MAKFSGKKRSRLNSNRRIPASLSIMPPPRVPRFILCTLNARGSNRHMRPRRSAVFKRRERLIKALRKANNGRITTSGSIEPDGVAVGLPETQESITADLPEDADYGSAIRPAMSSSTSMSDLSEEDGLSSDYTDRFRWSPGTHLHVADELLSLPATATQNSLLTEEYNQWRAFEERQFTSQSPPQKAQEGSRLVVDERQSASDHVSQEEIHHEFEELSVLSSAFQIPDQAAGESQSDALDYLSLRSRTSWSVQSQGEAAEEDKVIGRIENDAFTNTVCHLPEDSEWYSNLQPENPPDTELTVEWDSFLRSWQIRANQGLLEDVPLLVARKEHMLRYWPNGAYCETSPSQTINRSLHPSDRLKHFFIDLWLYENGHIPRKVTVDAGQHTIVKQLWGWEYEDMVKIASFRFLAFQDIALVEQLKELLCWYADQEREADEREFRHHERFEEILHRTQLANYVGDYVEDDMRPPGVFIEDVLWGLEGVFARTTLSRAPSRAYYRNALNIVCKRMLLERYDAYYAAIGRAATIGEVKQSSTVQDPGSDDAVRVALANWQEHMWEIYVKARIIEDRPVDGIGRQD